MEKTTVKKNFIFWFVVGAIWLLTFCMDFLNPNTSIWLYLLHGGCAAACFTVGVVFLIRYKKAKKEDE